MDNLLFAVKNEQFYPGSNYDLDEKVFPILFAKRVELYDAGMNF
jgi:hypothetical protein